MQKKDQSEKITRVRDALAHVIDPELDIPITEMGLIYNIAVTEDGVATITITLTTIGCPLYETIHNNITKTVSAVDGITDVVIDLTFDPPWSPEMMSDKAKAEVGLI